jgi:hypothetical protein
VTKKVFLTLDFEEDFGSVLRNDIYFCHKRSDDLVHYVKSNNLKVTLFITGKILDERPELLSPFLAEKGDFQFELHSYDHKNVYDGPSKRIENIDRGIGSYGDFFGHSPKIYRAPDGVISRPEVEFLSQQGILWSSSLFPAKFPRRFDFCHLPRHPFGLGETGVTEIPFSVTRLFRIPIALSYMQLLGLNIFRFFFIAEDLQHLVFDFHLHDLFPGESYVHLPFIYKLAYFRSNIGNCGFRTFEKAIFFFRQHRFEFSLLRELVADLEREHLNNIDIEEVFI